jgi:hypothetical protein
MRANLPKPTRRRYPSEDLLDGLPPLRACGFAGGYVVSSLYNRIVVYRARG